MWWLARSRSTLQFLLLGRNAAAILTATTTSFRANPRMTMTTTTTTNPSIIYNNVLLASSRLVPLGGTMTIAHQTRNKVFELLRDTMARRNDDKDERAMIVDITATTWNWDTYAIVAGTPQPIKLVFPNKEALVEHLPLVDEENNTTQIAKSGVLVPQPWEEDDVVNVRECTPNKMVWVPKGAILRDVNKLDNGMEEFVLEAPIDPNDDRLEHWEQEVLGKQWIYKTRAKLASECMRNMLRFYDLDRIICWDLSWGVWEAVRDANRDSPVTGNNNNEDGFPRMTIWKEGKDKISFPSLDNDDAFRLFYDYSRPISPTLLAETLRSVSGYYLVGGNTYTMSLFHHMWDQQADGGETTEGGHMQLLRNLLAEGTLFYLGHSAGAIMSGPNILTATFKGIDAFSVVTQPYNEPFMKLPPSESPETFFAPEKNNLFTARTKMLEKMKQYGAWRGYRVVEALAFPHYDSRPRFASFPQSAETYLRATDDNGRFSQLEGSLLVGKDKSERTEPADVKKMREDTNTKQLPCYPIANGHSIVLPCGGLEVVEALSPEEEGGGTLHWDTYMPNVPDDDYLQYEPGRNQFTMGAFTGDANTVAGDRSSTSEYNGARVFSRLDALGLPNPISSGEGEAGGLFRC